MSSSMLMRLGCEAEQLLNFTLEFEDGSKKNRSVRVGDIVTVDYNKNGLRKRAHGAVKSIFANPYNGRLSKKDWTITILNSHYHTSPGDCGCDVGAYVKIDVLNIVDLEVDATAQTNLNPIYSSPDCCCQITNMRINSGLLEISQDYGKTWFVLTTGKVIPKDEAVSTSLYDKIKEMLGDDVEVSDELKEAMQELLKAEIKNALNACTGSKSNSSSSCTCNC